MAPDVFDNAVQPRLAVEFLADPRHRIVVALDGTRVVGFAPAVHYVHPDKQAELWVNEVGVAPGYRRAGLAVRVIRRLLAVARELCWRLHCHVQAAVTPSTLGASYGWGTCFPDQSC